MTNLEIEKAAEQVELSQIKIEHAMDHLKESLGDITQKMGHAMVSMRKYPGLLWVVAGAIGTTAVLDFFANVIDSQASRGYNPQGNLENSDRA